MGSRKRKKSIKQSPAEMAGDYEIYHIRVLDGIRAVAILIIAWYHFWQQSWLAPVVGDFSLDWLVRNGSILVDMMILLSGFCLFLPYARDMVYGDKTDTAGGFYIKRVARIAPSYYLSLLIVLFCFAIPLGEYGGDNAFLAKDVLSHFTFTHNLMGDVMGGTHLNGVLWTVGVEVQMYLLFPLLAKWFRKWPVQTYLGMLAVGLCSSYWISSRFDTLNQGLCVNHTLTFFSVFANGMMGACLYMLYTKKSREKTTLEAVLGMVVAVGAVFGFYQMCQMRMASGAETKWQVDNRYLLSLVFLLFIFGVMLAWKWFRKIWDNRVMTFLAGISFNFYICHQYIAVKLKEFRIPDWEGDELPNMTGDVEWQWQYMILCIVLSFAVAVAMTYLVERPAAKAIKNLYEKRRSKQ